MILYYNDTRFAAIVTIKILTIQDSEKMIQIGVQSMMKMVSAKIGIHDLLIGPTEWIELGEGIEAQFLSARSAP